MGSTHHYNLIFVKLFSAVRRVRRRERIPGFEAAFRDRNSDRWKLFGIRSQLRADIPEDWPPIQIQNMILIMTTIAIRLICKSGGNLIKMIRIWINNNNWPILANRKFRKFPDSWLFLIWTKTRPVTCSSVRRRNCTVPECQKCCIFRRIRLFFFSDKVFWMLSDSMLVVNRYC